MLFKGTTLLARKAIVRRDFGDEAWTSLVEGMASKYSYFRKPLNASSLIPADEFLAFHDELVSRLYSGDQKFYWKLGADSCEWAFTDGTYARSMNRKDIQSFVESFPNLWKAYFPDTTSTGAMGMDGDTVWIKAENLPIWHPYFEYLVVGYVKRALELLGAKQVLVRRVLGGPNAGRRYHYELRIGVKKG
jgi:hypothetical protein